MPFLTSVSSLQYKCVQLAHVFGEFIERVAHPTDFLLKRVVQSCARLLTQHIHSQTNRKWQQQQQQQQARKQR